MTDLLERLSRSKSQRHSLINRFGFMPTSILKLSRGPLSRSLFSYRSENPERNTEVDAENSEEGAKLRETGWEGGSVFFSRSGRGKSGLSVMAAEIPEFFIKYYAHPGQVYLNPYAGKGIEMQVSARLGLHFYGYDIAEEFAAYNNSLVAKLSSYPVTLSFTCADSRYPTNVPDDCGHFSFYSPPYWDIEDYGDEAGQLGKNKTYLQFLDGLQEVAAAWLPKFKTNAWHVVDVGDFRKDGKFYSYHADLIQRYKAVGWELFDTWIISGIISGRAQAFAVKYNLERRAPRVHEYALVFRKP